jgi:hypothetical protein
VQINARVEKLPDVTSVVIIRRPSSLYGKCVFTQNMADFQNYSEELDADFVNLYPAPYCPWKVK